MKKTNNKNDRLEEEQEGEGEGERMIELGKK